METTTTTATVTRRGRITIPGEVLDPLQLGPGARVEFPIGSEGGVHLVSVTHPASGLYGLLERAEPGPVPIAEMDAEILAAPSIRRMDRRSRSRGSR